MSQQIKQNQDLMSEVWVVGHSILMDGIATYLGESEFSSLVRWESINDDFIQNIGLNLPIVIIFELDDPGSLMFLDLLRDRPGVHLLGIDRYCDKMIELNSIQRKTRTMTDLYKIISQIKDKRADIRKEWD